MEEFKDCQPQDGPVGGRHPRHPPVLAAGVEFRVERGLLGLHALHERPGEIHERGSAESALEEPFNLLQSFEMLLLRAGVRLELIERLKGDLTGSAAAGHGDGNAGVMRRSRQEPVGPEPERPGSEIMSEIISMAAAAHSAPLLPPPA